MFGLGEFGQVWGVYVGGCVAGEASWKELAKTDAHAHSDPEDPWEGWICVHSGRVSRRIILHELAHLLVPGHHNDRWRAACVALGIPGEAKRYPRKKRAPRVPDLPL